jgi:hypothetical protein
MLHISYALETNAVITARSRIFLRVGHVGQTREKNGNGPFGSWVRFQGAPKIDFSR